ncbi:hypothetical protein B0A55_00438 [Friedmanniomyces simplex]|uniref:Uncharacterized protein n=1 Tax=Friedmanniomyces simplex TaxID=329884 RepID=A0A4U0Y3A4_9PEZI|nr:hypothetical protein B0A55_00438 [Friedmanniomyces simplex]
MLETLKGIHNDCCSAASLGPGGTRITKSRNVSANMVPPLITLEEHFVSQHITSAHALYNDFGQDLLFKLQDLGNERIQNMDAGSVNLQIISHAPITASAEQCRGMVDNPKHNVTSSLWRISSKG